MRLADSSRSFGRTLLWRGSLLRSVVAVLGLTCVVFLIEEAMHYIGFFNNDWQAIWWPTNGLALALMVRTDRQRWPIILAGTLLGSLVGEIFHGTAWRSEIVNGIANAVGPVVGALALPRLRKLDDWLQEPHLVSRFVAFALVLGPGLSATIFATYLKLWKHGVDFSTVFQLRADSDMLGYAIFAPLVLVLISGEQFRRMKASGVVVAVVLLGTVAATTWIVFSQSLYELAFVLISVTLLVSMRLGFSASVLAVNLLAVLATIETMHGHGPLTLGNGAIEAHRIFLLQAFLTLTMVTVFSVSVMQIERIAYQHKLQAAYREMEKQATTDALTGIGNRRRFEDALEAEWARALRTSDPVAVLMIDVDHFKSYNDGFGHPAGDVCLRTVATAILEIEHRSSDLLARYGGEEFVLMLPATSLDGAAQIAEAIRLRIEGLFGQSGNLIFRKITVSIGCASAAPGPSLESHHLVSAADEALYRAKQNGRNRLELAKSQVSPAVPLDLNPVH